MRCSSCGFENLEELNFCGKCSAPLNLHFPKAVLRVSLDAVRPRMRDLTLPRTERLRQCAVLDRPTPLGRPERV